MRCPVSAVGGAGAELGGEGLAEPEAVADAVDEASLDDESFFAFVSAVLVRKKRK
jgi:hypothetical protein